MRRNKTDWQSKGSGLPWYVLSSYGGHTLKAHHWKVSTDHNALNWMFTCNDLNARLIKWGLQLSEVDDEAWYRPGVVHQALSSLCRPLQTSNTRDFEPIDDKIQTFFQPCCFRASDKKERSAQHLFFRFLFFCEHKCAYMFSCCQPYPFRWQSERWFWYKWLDDQSQKASDGRWFGCLTIYIKFIGRAKIWSIPSTHPCQ